MAPPEPRDEIEQRVVDDVARFGWHGVSRFPEPEQAGAYYYTVGLAATYGQPEILVVGRAGATAHGMARTAVEAFADGLQLRDGLRTDAILEGYDVRFVAVDPSAAGWLSLAGWYYGDTPWSAVQLLCPDREGRFPGEPGYDDRNWPQPLVTSPPPTTAERLRARRPVLDLSAEERRALDDVLERSERAVRAALAEVPAAEEPVAAALLIQDEDDVFPAHVAVATAADRERALRIEDPGLRWEAAWNYNDWTYDVLDVADHERREDLDARVIAFVRERGADDASRWILQEVCRRLAHAPPPGAAPRFACVIGEGLGAVDEDLAYVLSPEALADLEDLGLF